MFLWLVKNYAKTQNMLLLLLHPYAGAHSYFWIGKYSKYTLIISTETVQSIQLRQAKNINFDAEYTGMCACL